MTFGDEVEAEEEAVASEGAAVAAMRRERDTFRRLYNGAHLKNAELQKQLDFHDAVSAANPHPPKWLTPKRPAKGHRATVVAMLSDLHFDEYVNPDEIGGLNAYDREIAVKRLKKWTESVVLLTRDYLSGVTYDGAVVPLNGDIFSGNLHDLAETNEDTLFGSLLFWSEQMCAALGEIVDEFGKLHVPVTVGNHGRITHKPRTKLRVRDNVDWLLGHMVKRYFANDNRVTFDIPENTDVWCSVYNTTHLFSHGDQVTGGSGVGGIWPPVMRMLGRKAQRYASEGRTFDTLGIGHFHQLIMAPDQGLIVNGSMVGYGEYAAISNFKPERPQQALWLVTPENGITFSAPVLVADRRKEGW